MKINKNDSDLEHLIVDVIENDKIDGGYSMMESHMFIDNLDVNFDGVNDFGVLSGEGSSDVNYYYNFYKSDSQGNIDFTKKLLGNICDPEVRKDEKVVTSVYRSGPNWYNLNYFYKNGKYIEGKEVLKEFISE